MTDSIQIDSGVKHIGIDRDGQRVGEIVFNPEDVALAERFYKLVGEFDVKEKELKERAAAAEGNFVAGLALITETCAFFRDRIDYLFGAGVSEIVFGETNTLNMFSQFFDGIGPHFKTARATKMQKYIPTDRKPRKRTGHK